MAAHRAYLVVEICKDSEAAEICGLRPQEAYMATSNQVDDLPLIHADQGKSLHWSEEVIHGIKVFVDNSFPASLEECQKRLVPSVKTAANKKAGP